MIISNLNTNFSPYFTRLGRDRTKIPIAVNLVLGTDSFECSGIILARHSEVLLEMILQSREIYLDDFAEERGVLEDCFDLLHGGEVKVGLENIQGVMKFGLNYKVGPMFEACLAWVSSNIELDNLSALLRVGFIWTSFANPDNQLLDICKTFLLNHLNHADTPIDPIEKVTKAAGLTKDSEDSRDIVTFLMAKEFIKAEVSTLPTITNWVDSEDKAKIVLSKVDDQFLFNSFRMLPDHVALEFIDKMTKYANTESTLKIITKLQRGILQQKPIDREYFKFSKLSPCQRQEYIYAEVVVNWIGKSDHKLDDATVNDLWSTIDQKNLGHDYLTVLRNTITLDLCYQLPEIQDLGKAIYKFTELTFRRPSKRDIKERLLSDGAKGLRGPCSVVGCAHNSSGPNNHNRCLELKDTRPCYNLDLVDIDSNPRQKHHHHDLVKHWYLSTVKADGQRVLLSLVTNTYDEVMVKLAVITDKQVVNMHCLELGQRV